jgi:hypothetical protein
MAGPLIHKGDNDYLLAEGERSVWVQVGRISVYICREGNGVLVETYQAGQETDEPEISIITHASGHEHAAELNR